MLQACAKHRLAPLCGSAPGAGAVSYTLGGGLGPLGRRYGYCADRVRRLRIITATGELQEVTSDTEPDLFWAIRGGGGNFGITTEMEIDLFPCTGLYGGGLFFPGSAAPDLLAAFGESTAAVPDELSLSIAFITFPTSSRSPPRYAAGSSPTSEWLTSAHQLRQRHSSRPCAPPQARCWTRSDPADYPGRHDPRRPHPAPAGQLR